MPFSSSPHFQRVDKSWLICFSVSRPRHNQGASRYGPEFPVGIIHCESRRHCHPRKSLHCQVIPPAPSDSASAMARASSTRRHNAHAKDVVFHQSGAVQYQLAHHLKFRQVRRCSVGGVHCDFIVVRAAGPLAQQEPVYSVGRTVGGWPLSRAWELGTLSNNDCMFTVPPK